MNDKEKEQPWEEQVRNFLAQEFPQESIKGPSDLLLQWEKTVVSARYYSGSIFQWDQDVAVREVIDMVLENETLKEETEYYSHFKNQVERIDGTFKELSVEIPQRNGRRYWWERRILMFTAGQYEEDVRQFYDIEPDAFL